MGNKIITEKDFWMCSSGCVPAQMQGTHLVAKKKGGEIYITNKDMATSSFIDFGCNKYMLLMAAIAAVAVVAAVVVGVLTVATGGLALIAVGAIAGLAGAAIGGVVGGLLCGQKMASKRVWSGQKSNLKVLGTPTITGDHKMICPVGGTVTFAPQIKNWWQAISLGTANYIGKLFEGMMAGAAIGSLGAAWMGGSAAMAGGAGMRGLGQASLNLLKNMPKNFVVNIAESFGKVGMAFRGIMGAQNTMATYGNTGEAGIGDFAKGAVSMETGAYDGVKNIATGQGTWQDYIGTVLMFSPVGKGKRDFEDSYRKADDADAPAKDAETNKADEEGTTAPKDGDAGNTKPKEDGEAFEDGVSTKAKGEIGEAEAIKKLKEDGFTEVVQIQNNSGHGIDVIARNPETGNVKCVEVKANTSQLSEAQRKGGEEFVKDRLDRATSGEGHYKIPPNSEQMKLDAEKAKDWISDAENVDYEVHRVKVDNTTGAPGQPEVTKWDPKPKKPKPKKG